jgi:hypothetical protein
MADLPAFALSIRQPWAWAILHKGKTIENRDWPTRFRGPVCIHAAKGMTRAEHLEFSDFIQRLGMEPPALASLPRSAIVGTAEIIACVRESASPWFFGPWGFVLGDIRPIDPIPCRGSLGFFRWEPAQT